MDPFVPTSNGQLVNIVPVKHKWSKQTFPTGICRIEPNQQDDFEAVE